MPSCVSFSISLFVALKLLFMHLCVQYNYDFCYLLCFLFFFLKTLEMFNEQFTIEGIKGSVGVLTYRKSQKQERIKKI